MPNHITNVIRTTPEVALALVNSEGKVDFNRLIPEPDNLEQGECSGYTTGHPEGVVCWYEWHLSHWGTKWNAYNSSVTTDGDVAVLRFDTAWSHPAPVIAALAARFPDAKLQVQFADEDLGFNFGEYWAKGEEGDFVELPEKGTDEATDWACQLKYGKSYADMRGEDE